MNIRIPVPVAIAIANNECTTNYFEKIPAYTQLYVFRNSTYRRSGKVRC